MSAPPQNCSSWPTTTRRDKFTVMRDSREHTHLLNHLATLQAHTVSAERMCHMCAFGGHERQRGRPQRVSDALATVHGHIANRFRLAWPSTHTNVEQLNSCTMGWTMARARDDWTDAICTISVCIASKMLHHLYVF